MKLLLVLSLMTLSFQAFADRKMTVPDGLICAWLVADSSLNNSQGVGVSDSVSIHCVSKASIKRDELEIKKLELEIASLEAKNNKNIFPKIK